MKHILALIATLLLSISGTRAQWIADSVLSRYVQRTVVQPNDYQGKVYSTIIKRDTAINRGRGILYIHGFNDYFFQSALGDSITAHGWNFRAVDLRRYGRSLRPGMQRFQVRNLKEYFPDIDSALVDMKHDGIDTVVIIGHSTGGLIASLYVNDIKPTQVKGLILNSPFLAWNLGSFTKNFLIPTVSCIGAHFPNIKISQGTSTAYSHSLLSAYDGEWEYDTSKKLMISPPVSSGWIHAIQTAQTSLKKHADIRIPILLMHSSQSVSGKDASKGDAVLNVDDISRFGRQLGPNITEATFTGGLHDLILSAPTIRTQVYKTMFQWLNNQFGH